MTKLLAVTLAIAAALAACGGTTPDKGTGPNGNGAGSGSAAASDGAGSGSAAPAPARLTEDDCRRMYGHIIDVALEERRKHAKPTDPQPTPEQVAELKAQQAKDGMEVCLASPRDQYECIMAAKDPDALAACGAE